MFIIAAVSAQERRWIAEEALREAAQKMAESDELAQRAESVIQGGVR
jgi:uncharacterized protein YciI